MKDQLDIKHRIFNTAVRLFANKSYGMVGVREIAQEANVSISMISYHFGSKVGILKAIFEEHSSKFKDIMESSITDDDFETNVRQFINGYINLIRKNRDLMMVWNSELNNDIPEVNDVKNEQLIRIKSNVNRLLHKIGLDFDRDVKLLNIIGPAIIQMIYSHFVLGRLLDDNDHEPYDDKFYERYANMISEMVLTGMKGLIEKLYK
jgi:AcrR family transcriptional regulator